MTAIRVATAAALAVALLSLSLPAVDAAREDRADSIVRTELDQVERAGQSLLTDGATAADVPGARRTLWISVPRASASTAPVEHVAFGGAPPGDTGVAGSACPGGDGCGSAGDSETAGASPRSSPDGSGTAGASSASLDRGTVAIYRPRDGPPESVRLDLPPIRTPDGPLVLGPGTHRLTLELVRTPAVGVVVVVRAT